MPLSNRCRADGASPSAKSRNRSRQHLDLRRRGKRYLEIANRLIDSITDRFFLLATHPHVGRARNDELAPGRRSFPVGEYVIVYRVEDEDVLILRVVHGRRDLEAFFGD